MTTVQQLIDDVVNEGAFDATEVQVLRWLDRRHKQMCARGLAYVVEREADVLEQFESYTSIVVPVGLVQAFTLSTNAADGAVVYTRGQRADVSRILAGTLTVINGGIFVEQSPTEPATLDERYLLAYPATPSALPMLLVGAFEPPTLTADQSANGSLRVDDEFVEPLLAGVFATALSRPNEGRVDLASSYEAQFLTACEELRRRQRRVLRGVGPAQIRVIGA